jgi:hypothetical protein
MNGDSEKPPAVDAAEPAGEIRAARQFSLGGLLWFAVLFSLWCSQVAIAREYCRTGREVNLVDSPAWLTSIFLAWIVLSFFCYRQKFYWIFLCHCLLPLAFVLCHAPWWQAFVTITFVMNLLCFPGAVLAMVSRWLSRGKNPDGRH